MQDRIGAQAVADEPRAFNENKLARRWDISVRTLQSKTKTPTIKKIPTPEQARPPHDSLRASRPDKRSVFGREGRPRRPGHPPSRKSPRPTKHFPDTRPCNCGLELALRRPDGGADSMHAFSFGMPGIGGSWRMTPSADAPCALDG